MKTSEEWLENLKNHPNCKFPTPTLMSWEFLEVFIKTIQEDAQTQALEYKAKWHEARRHLRAANKGAERSAKALELSATRYWDLVNSDKRIKERDENQHKTIVWNWLLLSDEDLRLKCGELSSQDIRNIRAVLRAMLGSSVRLKHEL